MTRATRSEWAERVRRWRASGASARTFAEAEGINPRTLQWWSSALKREGPSTFIDVTSIVSSAESATLTLEIGATRIRVSHGFDAALLREIIVALEAR
jgi:hypothetical protein